MVSTNASYSAITRDLDLSLKRVEKQPFVQRETEYYLKAIEKVKTIDEFVSDSRLFSYAMKAHGLEDMTYAKAFMVKVLEGGVEDDDSFANTLSDTRYREFAETFNFARHGETATVFTRAQQGTVDNYMRQTLEEDAGATNEAVRLALYFERKAPEITDMYEILADTALAKVVRTTLGLPDSFALLDIDKQVEFLGSKIDIEDFKEPEALAKLITRFTSMWDVQNQTSSGVANVSILFSQPAEFGISTDLLLTMQQLKA
ncbi:DUF1217 domain-containing protein [Aquibium sp. ELW1220]|uniref:DUF1217 domain-containing protein n=1 Tax=Aquibium sp. ELW1220 TaxID=2976766 RepID=UPI0025B05223|nr:DUF1217 domain-containing protein [Aquibium sp. ELW1220]MDN2580778.1 DUF1217 domain-containing protein [Aquibium sp. ELW1220]